MPERTPPEHTEEKERGDKERRRTPRFNWGGLVEINRLPSDGIFVPGKIRDLSLRGCCVDTTQPIDRGVRAEIVVRLKTASFRAVGEVRAIRGRSETGIEFIHLSAFGKEMLSDLIAELARMQAFLNQLRSAHPEMDLESFRKELDYRKLHAQMLSTRFPFLVSIMPEDSPTQGSGDRPGKSSEPGQAAAADKGVIAEKQPLVIPVDIFG
jgi:hypothetical protein